MRPRSTGGSSRTSPAIPRTDHPLGRRAPPRRRRARAAAAKARREPAVQHRHAGRRREPRAAAARTLVRDGAAGGRRPVLRAAADEGVRLGLRARPARDGAHRAASGLARGVPAEAERRVGARRLQTHRPGSRTSASSASSKAAFGHRRKTLANSLSLAAVASREQAVAALASIGRERERPRRGARAGRVRRARRSARVIGAAPAKINLALVVGPVARRRQARARDRLPACRPRRPGHASSRRAETTVDGFPEDTIVRARARRARRAARLARADREADPGRGRARRAAAPTRRPRSGSRTRSSSSRSSRPRCTRWQRGVGADVPFFLRDGPQLGTGDGTTARAARPAAGLRRAPAAAEGRAEAVDRRRSTRRSTRAAGRTASTSAPHELRDGAGGRPPSARPRASCRRTTSRARRTRTSCAALGAFRADVSGAGPAVYAPLPPARRRGGAPRGHFGAAGGSGSRFQRGTVERDVRHARDRTRLVAARVAGCASGACASRSGSRPSRGCSTSSASSTGGRLSRSPAIALLFWWYAGRAHRSDTLRQASWIFAASQLLVLCVPIALRGRQGARDRRSSRCSRSPH